MKYTNEQQLDMIKRIQSSKDETEIRMLKGLLLDDYEDAIKDIVRYLDDGTFDKEDVLQEGYLAFINAIDNFDTRKKILFQDFIHSNVDNKVKRAIEDAKREQTFPEELSKKLNKIIDAEEELTEKLKRYPTNDEVSDYLEMDFDEFFDLKKYALELLEIDGTIENLHKTLGEMIAMKNTEADNSDSSEGDIAKDEMEFSMSILSERERKIISMAYGLGGETIKENDEIANEMGISTERVRQIINLAKTKMKRDLEENYED